MTEVSATSQNGLGFRPVVVETVSGVTAGLLATIVGHPLDLVKTRLQIDRSVGTNRFGTSLRVARGVALYEGRGWIGLYRGLAPNLTGNMVGWGLYFMLYGQLKATLSASHLRHDGDGRLRNTDYLLTSACAGAVTAVCTNPLWVIKTRMLSTAANSPRAYPTMASGFADVLAQEGPKGLMRGLVPAMFGVSHGALQFMFYESLKEWRRFHRSGRRKELGTGDWLVLSASAKLAAGALTYPYKVVQTRMQDFGGGGKGPVEVCKGILWGEGLRGFYKGLAPNLLRVLPSTCITFMVYENAKRYLG